MNKIRLAIMSDLHVGITARSTDLCPDEHKKSRAYKNKICDNYKEQFLDFLKGKKISADYLIIPGDITDKSTPSEVGIASQLIQDVAELLKIDLSKIIFVPGNHDVDWTQYDKNDINGIKWANRYSSITYHNYIFGKITTLLQKSLFNHPYFCVWNQNNLLAIGYNSASHDTPTPVHAVHFGAVLSTHIDEMKRYLDGITVPKDTVKLFVIHHHPINYTLPTETANDFSTLNHGEKLLDFLHEYDFDLLIHGHRHHPRFVTHGSHFQPFFPILCAGSFSHEIESQWIGTINNQFHLISIDGRDTKKNQIQGHIHNWSYIYSRGWVPSITESSGIAAVIPFGYYLMPTELEAIIEPCISDRIKVTHFCSWKQIVEKFPELQYLPLDAARKVFQKVSSQLGASVALEPELLIWKE